MVIPWPCTHLIRGGYKYPFPFIFFILIFFSFLYNSSLPSLSFCLFLRRARSVPARWPVSHSGGAAASALSPRSYKPFFFCFPTYLISLFSFFNSKSSKKQIDCLDLQKKKRKFILPLILGSDYCVAYGVDSVLVCDVVRVDGGEGLVRL